MITEEQADQIICAIFNDNDRLNEIRELNPDYDISMHKLNVCVGDSQYRLVYCIYVEHKESGISVYRDKDFDVQEVINRLPSKFTIEKEQEFRNLNDLINEITLAYRRIYEEESR